MLLSLDVNPFPKYRLNALLRYYGQMHVLLSSEVFLEAFQGLAVSAWYIGKELLKLKLYIV